MKHRRRVLRWWMPRNCLPTGTSCSTHRVRVERLEDRNCLASDLVEETAVTSIWKEDSKIEATDSYIDMIQASQNQIEDESKDHVFENDLHMDVIKGNVEDNLDQQIENFVGNDGFADTEDFVERGFVDIKDIVGKQNLEDAEKLEDTKNLKDTEDTESVNDSIESVPVEAINVEKTDEEPPSVEKPMEEPSDEALGADEYTVEWIEDTATDSENPECPIDPETGYESFCQGTENPGKNKPDRHVDFPNAADTESKSKEAESATEFIPTIVSSRRERIASPAIPLIELSRPQVFGLRQLTIDPDTTIGKTETVRLHIVSKDKIDFANAARAIEVESSTTGPANISRSGVKNSPDNEKPSDRPLAETSNSRFQQTRWRRSVESLRPLISQIPWLSPLLNRPAMETEKNKVEDAVEPETVSIQPRDLHRSPSDKAIDGDKERRHTKSDAIGEQSPISSRATKTTDLPAQVIRNSENNPDSHEVNHPAEGSSPSNRRWGLFFPGLIGLTIGQIFWRLNSKYRNKNTEHRPITIESERDE